MIYLIYGEQYPLINKRCKRIVKSILGDEIDEFNYVRMSAKEVLVQDIVYECSLLPLCGKKVIRIDEPYFLTNSKDKLTLEGEQDFASLVNYINEDNDDLVNLIFVCETNSLNKKTDIYKSLEKKAEIIFEEGLTPESLKETGGQFFKNKGVTITYEALEELIKRCNDDVSLFIKEAEKLSLYSKNLTLDDIKIMTIMPLEENAFSMCENLINGKINDAIKTYRDLLVLKEEPVRILYLLATQFRFYTEVSYLFLKERYDQNHIATELNVHPYRVKLALSTINKINYDKLIRVLDYLFNLDKKIKSMEIEPSTGLELFMVKFEEI